MNKICCASLRSLSIGPALPFRILRYRRKFFAILVGLTITICVTAGMAQKVSKPHSGIGKVPVVVQSHPIAPPSAIPKPPPPPPPAEKRPPEPPLFTYYGEQLTIVCDNSTLTDILAAVQAQTGAGLALA